MIDFDALVLVPAYDVFGVDATLVTAGTDAREETLRVQDRTAGIRVAFDGGKAHVINGSGDLSLGTVRPAAAVRLGELSEKDLTPDQLREGALTFNGHSWRIKTHLPEPAPNGVDSGEIYFLLEAQA